MTRPRKMLKQDANKRSPVPSSSTASQGQTTQKYDLTSWSTAWGFQSMLSATRASQLIFSEDI